MGTRRAICGPLDWTSSFNILTLFRMDKLIQYIDFIQGERLRQYFSDNEKNGVFVKIYPAC